MTKKEFLNYTKLYMEKVEASILFGQILGDSLIEEFILLLLCVALFEGMEKCNM